MFPRIAMMMNALKLALLVSLVEASSHGIKSDFVLVKTQYTFPGNASSCERAEWRKISPTYATIATYQNQKCTTKKVVNFTCKENHLVLNSAKKTDLGIYEFICDGDKKTLRLDVLYALNVEAAAMDNITLECYADNANGVTWLHKNDRVLSYKKDGSINIGKGYEERVSLEPKCLKTGDYSLTITGFLKTDAGIYRCFLDDETTKGDPHAHHVNEKRSSQGNQSDSKCNEAQTLLIALGIISAVLLLVVVVLLYKLRCTNTKSLKGQSTPDTVTYRVQKSDDDTTVNSVLLADTESQLMVSHPVQESDTTGNKLSNTRPF
ncbi:uncharacterized protein [Pseudorasbora parva]|uniref:uncharacterized protein n=1 Tax=Pseudorasbora parva TaxID=51549 RepID=UPI00351DC80F